MAAPDLRPLCACFREREGNAVGSVNRVFVDDVDERYVTFRTRDLNTT
jgi:hypothetical protein